MMTLMQNIARFPASPTMSVIQALQSALAVAEDDDLREVVIIGYRANCELLVRSSKMSRKDALWLAEQLRQYALEVEA